MAKPISGFGELGESKTIKDESVRHLTQDELDRVIAEKTKQVEADLNDPELLEKRAHEIGEEIKRQQEPKFGKIVNKENIVDVTEALKRVAAEKQKKKAA